MTCNTTPVQEVQHFDGGREMVKALKQVIPRQKSSTSSLMETYFEQNNPDDSRRLQLVIQDCMGKAREAVESCANLPVSDGYQVAKETLREKFGKPNVIADAQIKKLLRLPSLKYGHHEHFERTN